MNAFDFISPTSLDEVLRLLSAGARPIAGGTDLLTLIKDGISAPPTLVSLERIAGFSLIREDENGLHIGAGARIADVLAWRTLRQTYPLLAQACQYVGWPEIRAMGSIGGNLCQRPRCGYFRHPLGAQCLKRGGDRCYVPEGRADGHYAIYGGGPCWAVHPSDIAPALVALDATVAIASHADRRTIPVEHLFSADDVRRETIVRDDELLTAIHVPKPPHGARAYYRKSKRRQSHDFSGVSVALSAVVRDGVCVSARLALGSVALTPWRLHAVEQLLIGRRVDAALTEEAARLAVRDAKPIVSTRGTSNRAKVWLVEALVKRAAGVLA